MKLPICDITPFTMQDFPDYTACILWFGGCSMRCVYCHNPELVLGKKERLPWNKIDDFLKSRQNLLDGVVLSGGECTLSPELSSFVEYLKGLNFKIKLDTNGLQPDVLKSLISKNYLDYIALDYKATKSTFTEVTGINKFEIFEQSLQILCSNNIEFEVRTTVHTDLINENDINKIINHLSKLNFRGKYYIQDFQPSEKTLASISEQKRKLDIDKINRPDGFKIETRNF